MKKSRVISFALLILLTLSLCSCGESSEAKLRRLESNAAEARQKADKARDDYNSLKNFVDKYGN